MKKLLVSSCFLGLSLIGNTFANTPQKPAKCPEVSAIQSVGFDFVKESPNSIGIWELYTPDNTYGTDNHWGFFAMISADNEESARQKMNVFLSSMQLEGPKMDKYDKSWSCFGSGSNPVDGSFYLAAVMTPPVSDSQIKSFIKRKGLF